MFTIFTILTYLRNLFHFFFFLIYPYSLLFSTIWVFVVLLDVDIKNGRFISPGELLDICGWFWICIFLLLLEIVVVWILGFFFIDTTRIKALINKYW